MIDMRGNYHATIQKPTDQKRQDLGNGPLGNTVIYSSEKA
jgi:hypothetical protein